MLHLRFDKSAGLSEVDATTYAAALNTAYGMPRGATVAYAVSFGNQAAKMDPLDPMAAWAIDISIGAPLDGDDGSDPETYVTPSQLDALSAVPFPSGAYTFEWSWDLPGWVDPSLLGP